MPALLKPITIPLFFGPAFSGCLPQTPPDDTGMQHHDQTKRMNLFILQLLLPFHSHSR